MQYQDDAEVIRILARGVNPTTGELFPKDSPYNHPRIIRALYNALESIPKRKRSARERQAANLANGLPRNAGLPWNENDRILVKQDYTEKVPIQNIAQKLERTTTAIVAELKRQGVISEEQAIRLSARYPFGQTGNKTAASSAAPNIETANPVSTNRSDTNAQSPQRNS